jgi:electron transfer flavoprotein beta subunit
MSSFPSRPRRSAPRRPWRRGGSGGVVPGAVAAALGWPLLSRARELTLRDGGLEASCAADPAARISRAGLPAVVSFADGAIEPCNPRLAAVLAARRAEVPAVIAAELLGDDAAAESSCGIVSVEAVPPRARQQRVVRCEEAVRELLAVVGAAVEGEAR